MTGKARTGKARTGTAMTGRPEPTGWVVFDLDGVFRQWNDDHLDNVEREHGLEPRTILSVAFSSDLGPAATTGQMTYRQWMDEIRLRVTSRFGPEVSSALDRWEENVGFVDWDMIGLLRRVRQSAPVALLSNGTTRLRRDLHVLGITEEFDRIFNTAEIGVAKPDPLVFEIVCSSLAEDPRNCVFVDDLLDNVAGAASIGMTAHQHCELASTQSFFAEMGLHQDP
jgi:putative hydrolase of the HAD superfamily